MDIHSKIEIPDFNVVMNKFNCNLNKRNSESSISKKIALVASFTLVIGFSTFLSSIPKVAAFKFSVIKSFEQLRGSTKNIMFSTNDGLANNANNSVLKTTGSVEQIEMILSIDEAKKEVPFELLIPKYIPDAYKLETVKLVKAMGDYFSINQTYTNGIGKIIQIYQSTVSENEEETLSMSSELQTEDIISNSLKIKLITDNKNFKIMIWFDNNIKHKVLMPYNFTNTEMKRIIGLLK
jgi:hypothetical protein